MKIFSTSEMKLQCPKSSFPVEFLEIVIFKINRNGFIFMISSISSTVVGISPCLLHDTPLPFLLVC